MRSNYIGGRWTPSAGDSAIEVVNPATEQVIDEVPAGHERDVEEAVHAAAAALRSWSATSAAERAARLEAARELLEQRADAVAAVIIADVGSPASFARKVQVGTPLAVLASYVDLLASYDFGGERVGNSLIVSEPVGVVGAITPWNYPLHQIVAKVAAGARGGLHGGPQAERGRPARRLSSWPTSSTRPGCPPACSTWSAAPGR